jgi:hypothetical protein
MAKILVTCYSRGGTTLRVAEEIARALGAELDTIEEGSSRKGQLGFMRSALEALAKGLPSIRTNKSPSDYDLVVLGTPVWVGNMSSPMRSYLFLHHQQLRRVALFATMRGQGAEDTLRDMKLLCRASDASTCSFIEHEVKTGRHRPNLERFVASLKVSGATSSHASAAA